MTGTNNSYMDYIYADRALLEYLRYNPAWYKILYYEPNRFPEFYNEANIALRRTLQDRISKLNKQLTFISSLSKYFQK